LTHITLKFTAEELKLLASLASDQLFRREFIDPRLPGHKSNPGEVRQGKELVERLKTAAGGQPAKTATAKKNGATV